MRLCLAAFCVIACWSAVPVFAQPQDTSGRLTTRWTQSVSPFLPHPEYPRPTMVRAEWLSLNGPWEWEPVPEGLDTPDCNTFSGTILVPFPVESRLSGIGRHEAKFWCRRSFDLPDQWRGGRVLLHFGAVDWEARVWVNGKFVGEHRGGYDPFSFDITGLLVEGARQAVMVRVADPTDSGTQPRGKQVRDPHGIWYTPTTGIWQSVWIEPVPAVSIERVEVTTDFDAKTASVTVGVRGGEAESLFLGVVDRATRATVAVTLAEPGQPATIDLAGSFHPWSPEAPNLYNLLVTVVGADGTPDVVESYFGVRKIEVRPDDAGVTRIHLNNAPIFLHGPLDQGFWPDGLYTAPTDEALRFDLEVTKRLGFNAVRKHVKVEPERWYFWCDQLGLAVIQDMPSGDRYIGPDDPDITRGSESAARYEAELSGVIGSNREHPSIVMWSPFNEGWGQFDTARITDLVRTLDPSRLVDSVSGWADRGVGDVYDWHVYPGPGSPRPEPTRAAFLGEYGGLGLPLEGHTWQDRDNWGYRSYDSREALTEAYVRLVEQMRWLIADPGLSGAIYTQTTDVEVEVNGLLTYDREIIKMDEERVRAANLSLYGPPPRLHTVAPCALQETVEWRYTTEAPAAGWEQPGFDDGAWKAGAGGFGRDGTPGAINNTVWETGDLWVRRRFILPRMVLRNPMLRIHHDEDCEVYINGVPAAALRGYTTGYVFAEISPEARAALVGGPTVLAIHCRQTGGGQYLDAGLVDLSDR